ncbi:MAG TPA: DUF393 domain-containing protein [Phycisphaerae bacterium]|nr:DUF393 domain-containing protein [Phycisphaerae bacterium]
MQAMRTDQIASNVPKIVYDADCGFCSGLARRFGSVFRRRGFEFIGLRSWLDSLSDKERQRETIDEMRVVARDGRIFRGADAVLYLLRQVPLTWLFGQLGRLPGVHDLLRRAYASIARRRYCFAALDRGGRDTSCENKPQSRSANSA